jgi:hypothetical protein
VVHRETFGKGLREDVHADNGKQRVLAEDVPRKIRRRIVNDDDAASFKEPA